MVALGVREALRHRSEELVRVQGRGRDVVGCIDLEAEGVEPQTGQGVHGEGYAEQGVAGRAQGAPVRRRAIQALRGLVQEGPQVGVEAEDRFTVEVRIGDEVWGRGVGRTKRAAERAAAARGLEQAGAREAQDG